MKRNVLLGVSAAFAIGGLAWLVANQMTEDCPEVQLQPDFQALSYQGLWYEHARDKNIKFEKGDCQ